MITRNSETNKYELPFQHLIDAEKEERKNAYFEGFEEAGRIIPPEEYARRDKGESQLELMGHKVAERLVRLGRKGYHTGDDTYFVGANSQTEKLIPKFWRSNANPYVQRQKRRNIFKFLSWYMQEEIEEFGAVFRMWVIHDGPRCVAAHLPKRWSQQAALVSDWNESQFAEDMDVEIVFRSAEAGSPVRKAHEKEWNKDKGRWERPYLLDDYGNRIPCRDEKNRQTWHPHSHLIVRMGRWLSEEEWLEVLDRAQAHFGTKKLDAGHIKDPREACKYVLKCDELDSVRDIDFLRFQKWTFKRRLVSFYGDAKKIKSDCQEQGWRIKSQWCAKREQMRFVYKPSHHVSVVKFKDQERKPAKVKQECVLVARLDPVTLFSPIAEPVLLVRGRVDWDELYKKREVREVLERSQVEYEAAVDAFPLIYGCSLQGFLSGAPIRTEGAEVAELGFGFSANSAVRIGSAHTPPVISDSPDVSPASEIERASLKGGHSPGERSREPQLPFLSAPEKTKPADLSIKRASLKGELYQTNKYTE